MEDKNKINKKPSSLASKLNSQLQQKIIRDLNTKIRASVEHNLYWHLDEQLYSILFKQTNINLGIQLYSHLHRKTIDNG